VETSSDSWTPMYMCICVYYLCVCMSYACMHMSQYNNNNTRTRIYINERALRIINLFLLI